MSTDYSVNALQVINAALRAIGVLRSGDSVANDSQMQSDCLEALNLMLKNWQSYGMEQWSRTKYTISNLTPYKSSYTISNGGDISTSNMAVPEHIVQAYVTPQANVDVECQVIGMSEYWGLANKEALGQPNQVAYYFQNTSGVLYVWPVPTVNTYSLSIIYQKPYNDFDTVTDLPDIPQRWFEAAKWNLALRLAPEFGKTVSQELLLLAKETLDLAIDAGWEEPSVVFQPDTRLRF
jgi:hypothetical protein